MSKTPQSHSPAAGDDRNLVTVDENYLAPSFDDRLRLFWAKNSRSVLAVIGLVILVIVIKGGFDLYQSQRNKTIASEYAEAGEDVAKLKTFAAAHADHEQGGLAQLKVADAAYQAGNYADARPAYQKAAGILKSDTYLNQRARLGAAISALQSGGSADGEAALKQLAADTSVNKIVRAEAAYNLATLAAEAGNSAEAIRLVEQATVIDPDGQWADRASRLRANLPAATTAAVVPAATGAAPAAVVPTVNFK